MPRQHSIFSLAALGLVAFVGCHSEPTAVDVGSTGSDEGGEVGEESAEGADTTAGSGEGCAPPVGGYFAAENDGILVPDGDILERGLDPEAEEPELPENWGLWAPGQLCADLSPMDDEPQGAFPPRLQFRIHRPQTEPGPVPGEWPAGRFPVLVFFHGNGADTELYDHIFWPLVEDGFIVVNVNVFEDDDTLFSAGQAAAGMACAVRYVTQQDAWPDSQRTGCGVSLAGHSRGAEAAVLAMGPIVEDGLAEIRAFVAIGRYEIGCSVPADYTVPLLVLAGAS